MKSTLAIASIGTTITLSDKNDTWDMMKKDDTWISQVTQEWWGQASEPRRIQYFKRKLKEYGLGLDAIEEIDWG